MSRTWSSRSTHRYGGHESSVAWSTSTYGRPDLITRAAGHGSCDEYWRSTGCQTGQDRPGTHRSGLVVSYCNGLPAGDARPVGAPHIRSAENCSLVAAGRGPVPVHAHLGEHVAASYEAVELLDLAVAQIP